MQRIKLFVWVFLLAGCTQLTGMQTGQFSDQSLDNIEQVAGQYIIDLHQDDDWYLFRIDLPAQAILADHKTGPRLIVLLTDLSGQRIADELPVTAQSKQVFYLENTLSKGFKNTANTFASYLVMPILNVNSVREFNNCNMPNYNLLIENSPIMVCESQQDTVFESTEKVLWYSHKLSQAKIIPVHQQQSIAAGDLIFELPVNTTDKVGNKE